MRYGEAGFATKPMAIQTELENLTSIHRVLLTTETDWEETLVVEVLVSHYFVGSFLVRNGSRDCGIVLITVGRNFP